MPWCPECGAEYREGIARCEKCDAALTEEAPVIETTPWRERVPVPLRRILSDLARALGYAAEAWRVLRRHPGLLALPVALAVFNAVERGTMSYVTYRYTSAGKEMVERWGPFVEGYPRGAARRMPLRSTDFFPIRKAVGHIAIPVTAASLTGTVQMVTLVSTWHSPEQLFYVAWALSLLALPLAAFSLAGYYGVVGKTVAEDVVFWPGFWRYARRYVLRFSLFGVLLIVIGGEWMPLIPLGARGGVYRAFTYIVPVITLAFGLTLVALVADDVALRKALKSGAMVVLRDLPIALCLLAAWVVVLGFTFLLGYLARITVEAPLLSLDLVKQQLYTIPEVAITEALLAAVGTWFLIVTFLWYRDRKAVEMQL